MIDIIGALKERSNMAVNIGSVNKEQNILKEHRRFGFDSWVRKIPWRRKWQPTPGFLPGKPHEQRSLAGYSPWGHKEKDMAEHAHTS